MSLPIFNRQDLVAANERIAVLQDLVRTVCEEHLAALRAAL